MKPRRTPYTEAGIRRVPCARCGKPSHAQWNICADGNQFRAMCLDCDIALNKLVVEWVGLPDGERMIAEYEARKRAEA